MGTFNDYNQIILTIPRYYDNVLLMSDQQLRILLLYLLVIYYLHKVYSVVSVNQKPFFSILKWMRIFSRLMSFQQIIAFVWISNKSNF